MIETHHVGRKIRNRRKKLGWSLEYAAEKCELCSRALEDIELGKTDPHLSTILKIAYGNATEIFLGICRSEEDMLTLYPNK